MYLKEKPFSKEALAYSTAQALADERERQAIKIMARLGLLEEAVGSEEAANADGQLEKKSIGIWEQEWEGQTGFVRSEKYREEWGWWANVSRIPPKGKRKRVVLIGESTAAGWPYDWQYSPAQVMQSMFDAADIPDGIEVVDLAKAGAGTEVIVDLLSKVSFLEPDALILFVGNNMSMLGRLQNSHIEKQETAAVLKAEGVAGLKNLAEERMKTTLEKWLPSILHIAENTPICWVLPEFNLADWSYEQVKPCPWLADDGNSRWLNCLAEAKRAVDENRIEQAENLASKLIKLDGGVNPHGFEILARCKLSRGLNDEARKLLENARDARTWDASSDFTTPRVTSVLQETAHGLFDESNVTLVDLSQVFAEWLDHKLPGKELFLDYCHMSAEGIRVAMAATVEQFATRLGSEKKISRADLIETANPPEPHVEGRAQMLAAVHNMEVRQKPEIIKYHAEKALQSSPEMVQIALSMLEQIPGIPLWTAMKIDGIADFPWFRDCFSRTKNINQAHIRRLTGVLAETLEDMGVREKGSLEEVFRTTHTITAEKPEFFFMSPYGEYYFRDLSKRGFYRAFSQTSSVSFVSSSKQRFFLRIVARCVDSESNDQCEIQMNGNRVGSFSAKKKWSEASIEIPSESVVPGTNHLTIEWPFGLRSSDEALKQAVEDLELDSHELYPVFGDIHFISLSLTESSVKPG